MRLDNEKYNVGGENQNLDLTMSRKQVLMLLASLVLLRMDLIAPN